MTKHITAASAIAIIATAGLGLASAAWAGPADIYFHESSNAEAAIGSEAVSLNDAIAAAQDQEGGHAIAAKMEPARGHYTYAIELVDDSGNPKVAFVDPSSGDVSMTDPFYGMKDGSNDQEGSADAGQ